MAEKGIKENQTLNNEEKQTQNFAEEISKRQT